MRRFGRLVLRAAILSIALAALSPHAGGGEGGGPPSAPEGAYTIAWLSDTQYLSESYPEVFLAMTGYLYENREILNLAYVTHTGDIVEKAHKGAQWRNASEAMASLGDIPHGVLAGNHDIGDGGDDANYRRYFGESRFADADWYGGGTDGNLAHFDLIEAGGTGFVFVYLSYAPSDEAILWAREAFDRHPERVGVLLAHRYLDPYGDLDGDGGRLFRELVEPCPNVRLALCGHRRACEVTVATLDDGDGGGLTRTVYQAIANFQDLEGGASGAIRFIEIDEAASELRFYTYSPVLGTYIPPDEDAVYRGEPLPIPWDTGSAAE